MRLSLNKAISKYSVVLSEAFIKRAQKSISESRVQMSRLMLRQSKSTENDTVDDRVDPAHLGASRRTEDLLFGLRFEDRFLNTFKGHSVTEFAIVDIECKSSYKSNMYATAAQSSPTIRPSFSN